MSQVEVKIEDLQSLRSSKLISNFQYQVLFNFFFKCKQLNDIAKDFKLPTKSIVNAFNIGHEVLHEFHRLRLRNLKYCKK